MFPGRAGSWKLVAKAGGDARMFDLGLDREEKEPRGELAPVAQGLCEVHLGEALAVPDKAKRMQGLGGGKRFRAGAIVIPNANTAQLDPLLKELGLSAWAMASAPNVPTHDLDIPRILYLQHPSDPIVWWSPSLLWSEPAWVSERTEASPVPPLRWRPVVTFWQVSGDLLFSNEVGSGHGHRYGRELADAWRAVAPH